MPAKNINAVALIIGFSIIIIDSAVLRCAE